MRTKDEIIAQYTKDGLGSSSDGALSMLTVLNVLEILIDIRDIIREAGKDLQEAIWNMPDKD